AAQRHHRRDPQTAPVLGCVSEADRRSARRERKDMKRFVAAMAVVCVSILTVVEPAAPTSIRVGWCSRTITSAAAPFAIATKMGWYATDGIKVELMPIPGSNDCLKFVATGEIAYSLPSVEPLAIIRAQGV